MRRGQKGYVLIMALIVIAGIVALMTMLAADRRSAMQDTQNQIDRRRADMAVQSAIASATALVQQANSNLVSANDSWAQLGDSGDEEFDLDDGSSFRIQILDAGSLVNVNTATQAQLQYLPLTQEQIDCLLDWRETGTTARADGAKDPYYNALPQPYNAKLGPLSTANELLLVKNWTAQTLYEIPTNASISGGILPQDVNGNVLPLAGLITVDSGSPNTQADGSARVNLAQGPLNPATFIRLGFNAPLAVRLAAGGPYTSFQSLLSQPGINAGNVQTLLNSVTFTANTRNEGKINLNTASQAVLQTIPNVSASLAGSIVSMQSSGFTSLGQIATLGEATPSLLAQIADNFTVGGDTWIVRAYGSSGGVGTAVEAVLGLRNNTIQVITMDRLTTTGIPAWWEWNAQTTSSVQAAQVAMTQLGTSSTTTGGSQ